MRYRFGVSGHLRASHHAASTIRGTQPARTLRMNNILLRLLVKFQTLTMREDGQDLVEYALVVGLISVAAVATLKSAATAINGVITNITTTLNNA